ncbi:MAG: hypothetical protein HYZ21_02130 [Chloroflexi bacterium]|nr:hypothetical protein [Chloroflexota bacterium]
MLPDTQETLAKAHLFTLRIWVVKQDAASIEWRVRLQDTHSGEVTYFRNWQELIASLEKTIRSETIILPNQPKEIT